MLDVEVECKAYGCALRLLVAVECDPHGCALRLLVVVECEPYGCSAPSSTARFSGTSMISFCFFSSFVSFDSFRADHLNMPPDCGGGGASTSPADFVFFLCSVSVAC